MIVVGERISQTIIGDFTFTAATSLDRRVPQVNQAPRHRLWTPTAFGNTVVIFCGYLFSGDSQSIPSMLT
jgi:hypothetical protein